MCITEKVRCPNCGSYAQRHHFREQKITQTACPQCDYFLVNCSHTGKVVEAYAPGLAASRL